MKKISIVGVLVEGANWILHPLANYKELQEYRRDYEREVLDFHKQNEKLKQKLDEERSDAIMKCLELAKKVEFYEKQAKKTSKEKVDYLMKRGKK